jgi:hypothetical protein
VAQALTGPEFKLQCYRKRKERRKEERNKGKKEGKKGVCLESTDVQRKPRDFSWSLLMKQGLALSAVLVFRIARCSFFF